MLIDECYLIEIDDVNLNLYLIHLRENKLGCSVSSLCVRCVMYADRLL